MAARSRASIEQLSRRGASTEYQDDAIRASTRQFAHAFEHMGLQHGLYHPNRSGEASSVAIIGS